MDPIFSGIIGAILGGLLTAGGVAAAIASRLSRVETKVEALDKELAGLRKQTDARIYEIADLVKTVVKLDTELLTELRAERLRHEDDRDR